MKIHLLSDIHTEFYKGNKTQFLLELVRPADVLVLAGDIAVGRQNVLEVIKFFAQHYDQVFFCPGNHEYYNGIQLNAFDLEFEVKLPLNAAMLNPSHLEFNNVTFIGGTLFTNFHEDPVAEQAARRGINDFQRSNRLTTKMYKDLFYQHSQYFKLAYEQRKTEKVVFFSHFLPDLSLVHERWREGSVEVLLNKYYSSNLGNWIASLDNAHWLFGHTHDHVDLTIGTTRCLAAPVGYPGENNSYQHAIIEI